MGLRNKLKKLVEQLTHTHIYRTLPRGIDIFQDIANHLPAYHADIVFDIGANVGQSAKLFLSAFPIPVIYCFEPVSDTYRQLQINHKGNNHVKCHQLALGSSKNRGKMVLQGSSDMFFLLGQSNEATANENARNETVDIVTLDDFCSTKHIDHINYLKIDTEGGDLDVLKGAVGMLAEQKIDFVQVEAGMNPANTRHVSFESIKAFLESHQYFLFGIYEQVQEWPTGKPHLRRTNPVFISQKMLETV